MIKYGWIMKLKRFSSLGAMLGVAACAVIGGSLYNWRQEQAEKRMEAMQAESEATSGAEQDAMVPELSESQIDLLDQIENAIEEERMADAAELMLTHGERLWVLFYDILGGESYLFCEGKLFSNLEGTGLVLRKPSTIFYGDFVNGKPEGEGTALQVIELEYPRYDYSTGSWANGKMNGEGCVGYEYYQELGEENRAVSRTGKFVNDKMDGDVTYSTTNAEDTVVTWNMKAKDGLLVLDDSWEFDEEKGTYQLLTNENGGHAFVATKEAAGSMLFQNMILWE